MPEPIKFGISIGPYPDGVPGQSDLFQMARGAEAAGFDSIQAGDHVQWPVPILEPTVLMGVLAAATTRIHIACNVMILPLRNPVLMANAMASLDVISGGRMVFGFGVGGENPRDFSATGIPITERGSRANESLEIITKLLAGERISHHGRHYSFEGVKVMPKPVQNPVPIWVGGNSDAALRRAAKYGHGWLGLLTGREKFSELKMKLLGLIEAEGRSPGNFTIGAFIIVNADPDAARARERGARYIKEAFRMPGESALDQWGVAGPVEACVEEVMTYVNLGAQYIVLLAADTYREWPRQLEAYREIITRVGA